MNPRKAKKKKLVVRFDEEARREYLTGFHKRKKQRRKKAKSEKLKREKELRNEIKKEKRSELKKKLNLYHIDEAEQRRVTVKSEHNGESSCTGLEGTVFSGVNTVSLDYPDHVVLVNTDPDLGTSLSSLANEDSHDTENIQAAVLSTTRKAKSSFISRLATPVIHE